MIRLVYPTDPNFGDAMSPLIVEKLSGQKVVPSEMWKADMMAVGSVFYRGDYFMADTYRAGLLRRAKAVAWDVNRIFSRPITVWGAGFLQYPPFKRPHVCRKLNILALRGHYTRRILESYGFMCPSGKCVYGDPGLLFANLFNIKANVEYDLGIIPHKYREDSICGKRLQETYGKIGIKVRLIDVTNSPIDVVRAIASCEKVMSSSLHGLIVADSLSIPNLHMGLSTLEFSQKDFELKFRDYYSSFGEKMPRIFSAEELLLSPRDCLKMYNFHKPSKSLVKEVQDGLLNTFPRNI